MRITIDSTAEFVAHNVDGRLVRARRWEGATATGIPVVAHVLGVSPQTDDPVVAQSFAAELIALAPLPETDPTEVLAAELLLAIRPELSRANGYRVLNALAIATAVVLAGARHDSRARDFFARALDQNLEIGWLTGAPIC